jgi:stage IV sporulation protein FB
LSGRNKKTKSGNRRFSLFYGRLRIHPLFLLIGLWNTLTGELAVFLCAALCAILHELAHAAQAAKLGYGAKELTLMPYGATIRMDLEDTSVKDELTIALAGPLCNLVIAALFLALWWCFPSAYPYTESAFYATLSLGLCNLIPAPPLDGGRVVYCIAYSLLNKHLPPTKSKKYAKIVGKSLTAAVCAVGLAATVLGVIRGQFYLSLFAFTLFLLISLFERKEAYYVKLDFSDRRAFERGTPITHVAVSCRCTLKKALSFLTPGNYLVLDVYDDEQRFLGSLTQTQLSDFFQKSHLYAPILEYFPKFT